MSIQREFDAVTEAWTMRSWMLLKLPTKIRDWSWHAFYARRDLKSSRRSRPTAHGTNGTAGVAATV